MELRDRRYPVSPQAPHPLLGLRTVLKLLLYEIAYTRLMTSAAFDRRGSTTHELWDDRFVRALSDALPSAPAWDGGWRIIGAPQPGVLYVAKGDLIRRVLGAERDPRAVLAPGGELFLAVERESAGAPGFHFVRGRNLGDEADEASLVRFYAHTRAETAAQVLRIVTSCLDDYGVPFRFKTLSAPALYDRADASVLYVASRHAAVVATLLPGILGGRQALLLPEVPMFCLRVAPGIGFAEDPANGESFGTDRCRMVAEAILDSWRAGDVSEAGRWASIQARFAACGVSLERPYLRPGQVAWIAPTVMPH